MWVRPYTESKSSDIHVSETQQQQPVLIAVAGPNGAGKSTTAPALLRDNLEVTEFVNADAIAAGLSAFRPESVAITAGRAMLKRIEQLAKARADFAFETTLASRRFAVWITDLKREGYRFHLLFLALESADLALSRIAERTRSGGHDVPETVVRRRYERGLDNFFKLYMPLADGWQMFDNSRSSGPYLIAGGVGLKTTFVGDSSRWHNLMEAYHA